MEIIEKKKPVEKQPDYFGTVQGIDAQVADLGETPAAEITTENTYVDPETSTIQFESEAAIKLVVDNAEIADNFVNINQWASGWTMADLLYQSPMSTSNFEQGTDVANSAVPKFMVRTLTRNWLTRRRQFLHFNLRRCASRKKLSAALIRWRF